MRLCCCFPKRSKPSQSSAMMLQSSRSTQVQLTIPQDSTHAQMQTNPPPPREEPVVVVKAKTNDKVMINSTTLADDIAVYDFTPTSTFQGKFRYSCPVCQRYFSHMLVTACCENYLCFFCASDLTSANLHFEVRCPHCNASPIVLNDVEPEAQVKFYSDSPNVTFKRTGGNFMTSQKLEVVVEGDKGDNYESDEERAQDHTDIYSQFARTV